ncbi:DUF4342 domain-containing protein [Peptoniphilus catoniae]|uniref:DUF4342 domain-containing protein n=1 Tax=Peptoniphilus catoniae TaxID=1660341 RepID=UPI0010FCEF30|nr:DUF4342 domain-containing protein [Peptoniphilus catoniae]
MITMEKIDYVMDVTDTSYKVVRSALLEADGDVDKAIEIIRSSLEPSDVGGYEDESKKKNEFISFDDIKDAIKDVWEKGNASRLVVKRGEETILSLSLTVSAFGIIIAPLAAILGVGAGLQGDYDFYLVMDDGETINIKEYIKKEFRKSNK